MSKSFSYGPVGNYYSKYPHEEELGPIFIRSVAGVFHVCVQDKTNKELYQIVADVINMELAENIRDMLISKHNIQYQSNI